MLCAARCATHIWDRDVLGAWLPSTAFLTESAKVNTLELFLRVAELPGRVDSSHP